MCQFLHLESKDVAQHPPSFHLHGNHLGGECCDGQFREPAPGRESPPQVYDQHIPFHSASDLMFG